MSESKENKVKTNVFGRLKKPEATGDYIVRREEVETPLVHDRSVIRACCTGCGYCLEVAQFGAKRLAEIAGIQKPDSWEGYYFESKRCRLCDEDYRQVSLKKISDLR